MRGIVRHVLGAMTAAALVGCEPRADLVVYGRVWTGDSARPWAEGIAVRGARIVAVGARAEVAGLAGRGTTVLDNGAAMVTPGFGDAHTHFISGGFQLASVDLRDADTPREFIRRIADFARRQIGRASCRERV